MMPRCFPEIIYASSEIAFYAMDKGSRHLIATCQGRAGVPLVPIRVQRSQCHGGTSTGIQVQPCEHPSDKIPIPADG
jgi:hypothetical protein